MRSLLARFHWYARSLRLLAAVSAARASGGQLFLLLSTVELLSPRQVRWLTAFAGRQQSVVALVLDFVHRPEPAQQLPRTHRFWLDAVAGGGGAAPPRVSGECTKVIRTDHRGNSRTTYYRAGRPELAEVRRGAVTTVEHLVPNGRQVRRDEVDERGRLVRVADLHPVTQHVVSHRYLDTGGRCWLSVCIDPADGTWGRAQWHGDVPREFASLRELQADWVLEQLTSCARPQLLAIGRVANRVATLVKDYPCGWRPASSAPTDGACARPRP